MLILLQSTQVRHSSPFQHCVANKGTLAQKHISPIIRTLCLYMRALYKEVAILMN